MSATRIITCIIVILVSRTPLLCQDRALLERAESATRQRNYEAAARYYAELVAENPLNGRYWYRKGAAEYYLRRSEASIRSMKKCLEYGYSVKFAHYVTGINHVRLGNDDAAFEHFSRALRLDPSWAKMIRNNAELATFSRSKRVRRLLHARDGTGSWTRDLEILYQTILASHYDPFRHRGKADWDRRYAETAKKLPKLGSDTERHLEVMKFVSLAGDGHTHAWPVYSKRFPFRMLPLSIYSFSDGFFIRLATRKHADLVGSRILEIGSRPVDAVFEAACAHIAVENPMYRRLQSTAMLGIADILRAVGAAPSTTQATLTVQKNGVTRKVTVPTIPLDYDQFATDNIIKKGWVAMNAPAPRPRPLWLRNPGKKYWFEHVDDINAVYVQYNSVTEDGTQPFETFCASLFAQFTKERPKSMILDIRMNEGGSTPVYYPLLRGLMKHEDRIHRLFVIIGRRTYSAAMNLTVDLEHWTNAIFVGEPTSSSPNFIGENKYFTLPFSGIQVSVSDRYHQRGGSNSTDKRIWIAPHLATPLSSSDFAENKDPALTAIRAYLRE